MSRLSPLLDQVAHPYTLEQAWLEVRRSDGAPGIDGVRIETFAQDPDALHRLATELKGGWYAPLPVRRCFIPKPDGGRRTLGIPAVRDRVVARAVQRVLTPRLERIFCRGSFAYRPGRSCRGAVNRVAEFLREGAHFVALLDIRDYFPSIDRRLLLSFLEEELERDPLVPIVGALLNAGAVELGVRQSALGHEPLGIEQGSPLSPLLSNLYLHPWDRSLTVGGQRWVRYSDNALIATSSREEAEGALEQARHALARLGLQLNAGKSQVRDGRDGFDFLGFQLSTAGVGPDTGAIRQLRQRLLSLGSQDARSPLLHRVASRRALLEEWLSIYASLRGLPVVDGLTLVAALQLATRMHDPGGTLALLRAPVEGPVEPELLELVRQTVATLGLKVGGQPEPEPSANTAKTAAVDASTRRTAPPGLPAARAAQVAWAGAPDPVPATAPAPVSPAMAPAPVREATGAEDAAPDPHTDPYTDLETAVKTGAWRQALQQQAQARGHHPSRAPVFHMEEELENQGHRPERSAAPLRTSSPAVLERPLARAAPTIRVSPQGMVRLRQLFRGAADRHALMWVDRSGRKGYRAVAGPLDDAAWRRHLEGESTLALLLSDEGRVHVAALDIDLEKPLLERLLEQPEALARALELTHVHALRVAAVARRRGLDPLVEDSGQKGRHVWLFFDPPASVKQAHALLQVLEADAGSPPTGLVCERFPPASRASSASVLLKLPLGIHRQSGRRSLLYGRDGALVEDVEAVLSQVRPCSSAALRAALGDLPPDEGLVPGIGSSSSRVEAVWRGCPVIAFLVEKATATHHLNHRERYTLLSVVGHLAEEGEAFLHAVIGRCGNYDRRITQRHISQRKESPVSCMRIREWLPEVIQRVPCQCRFRVPKGAYPTPVLYAVPGASRLEEGADRPRLRTKQARQTTARHTTERRTTARPTTDADVLSALDDPDMEV